MKNNLTIKTGDRIFLIDYNFDMGKKDICNLHHLPELVTAKNTSVKKISQFLNSKFVRISKKDLKAMCTANNVDSSFIDLY